MNIDLVSNMRFGDKEAFLVFLGDHAMAHLQYQTAVFAFNGQQIPGFDMAEFGQQQDWLAEHYEVHRALYSALGLGDAPDLQTVDLGKETQFYDWTQNHQLIHDTIDSFLGLK